MAARNQLLGMAAQDPRWSRCAPTAWTTRRSSARHRSRQGRRAGLPLADINATLSAAWGSTYVNDFIDRAASSASTCRPTRRSAWRPRTSTSGTCATASGEMVPFSAFASGRWTFGSPQPGALQRRARGRDPGPGRAGPQLRRGDGRDGDLAAQLPARHRLRMDRPVATRSGCRARRRRCCTRISILVVFLCLAALYESWSIPFSVMLVVPLGVLGALLAATLARAVERRLLPGRPAHDDRPAAKNAILIVEFAKEQMRAGHGARARRRSRRRACACGRS